MKRKRDEITEGGELKKKAKPVKSGVGDFSSW